MSNVFPFRRPKASPWRRAPQHAPLRSYWRQRASRRSIFQHLGFFALAAFIGIAWYSADHWYTGAARILPSQVSEMVSRTIQYATGPGSSETVTVRAPATGHVPAVSVLDGDTVRVSGETYRLVGFNTPETGRQARCDQENALGRAATLRLRELVAAGGLDFERVPCACKPGTEGTRECNFGRLCASLYADGRDVGSVLIAEGLAEPYRCSGTRCPPRRSWCG